MKHYVFVGSAGAYEANSVEPMHVEGDKRKPSAGGLSQCGSLPPLAGLKSLQRGGWRGTADVARTMHRSAPGTSVFMTAPPHHARHVVTEVHLVDCALPCTLPTLPVVAPKSRMLQLCAPSRAGHVEVEEYLVRQDLPYTVFQPLYIYGPHTAKDCEQCEWTPAAALGAGDTPLASSVARQFLAATLPGTAGSVSAEFGGSRAVAWAQGHAVGQVQQAAGLNVWATCNPD